MRQLFPSPVDDLDPAAVYGRMTKRGDGRAHVRVNMVESVDGAATSAGRSGSLSGPADKALFGLLRAVADAVVVGASTVRIERYGPPRLSDEQRSARVAAGLDPVPALAIVTASCQLDPTARLFTDAEVRPVVLTVATGDAARRARIAEVADVVVAGDTRVDLSVALGALVERGWTDVLSEGGPSLVGELFAADLVDEWCVTVAPTVTSGGAPRIAHGTALDPPVALELLSLLEDEGFLFLRYGRARNRTA